VTESPRVIHLNPRDNVAVALKPLRAGDMAAGVPVVEPIPVGHKVSLAAIPAGGDVVKYGEVIGIATAAIEPGHHVHVQNVRSARLPARD
jgi:altronate hydrolase